MHCQLLLQNNVVALGPVDVRGIETALSATSGNAYAFDRLRAARWLLTPAV